MTVQRVNEFYAADDKAGLLKQFFIELVEYIAQSKGCLECQLLIDEQEPSHFIILEKWQSKEHHQASLANYPAEEMQAAMPLFGQPPKGSYFTAC